jgi:uncharacterized protein (UPF0303 family)
MLRQRQMRRTVHIFTMSTYVMIVMMTDTPKTTFETILAVVLPVEGYIVKLEAKI